MSRELGYDWHDASLEGKLARIMEELIEMREYMEKNLPPIREIDPDETPSGIPYP